MNSDLPIDGLIFREVIIGGLSKSELIEKLSENKIHLNEFAVKFIHCNEFEVSLSKKKLQTAEISVGDLGLPNGGTVHEICDKAHELNFEMCPHEFGIHLRLQYLDLNQAIDPPKGNWQNILLKGVFDEPGFTLGFYLRRREEGFCLRGYRASLDYVWSPFDRFIFHYKS